MNKQGFLIRSGGVATALAAHALFFSALVAGQPRPDQYLAQMEAAPAADAPAQRQCDACAVAVAEMAGWHRLRF